MTRSPTSADGLIDGMTTPPIDQQPPPAKVRKPVHLRHPATPVCRPARVDVVIPCHDYGRFLGDAIQSAIDQTVPPRRIIVIDDDSQDNTREVADSFGDRVEYRSVNNHSAYLTRRDGYHEVTAIIDRPEIADDHVICFLDADDMMTPQYLETATPLFDSPGIGVVTAALERFGDSTGIVKPEAETTRDWMLRDGQRVQCSSLVRVSALQITGAFDNLPPHPNTHDDLWLWRNVVRHGYRCVMSDGVVRYRQHGPSRVRDNMRHPWFIRSGLPGAHVSILIPLSGRRWMWPTTKEWLRRQTWPRAQCRLVILDTSQDDGFAAMIRETDLSDYPDVTILRRAVGAVGLADADRVAANDAVQSAMCRIWTLLAQRAVTDWSLTLEDDMRPPPDVIDRLLRRVTGPEIDGVVSPYLSRTVPDGNLCVVFNNGRWQNRGAGVEQIEGAGFGSMLVRSKCLRDHTFTIGPHGYDPHFTSARRLRILCDWECESEHLRK